MIAMQTRCIKCGLEQYGPAVYKISHGEMACVWCGEMSKPMSEAEYQKHLDKYFEARYKHTNINKAGDPSDDRRGSR